MSYSILNGNVLDTLKTLPDSSIQTVVTSPPYWGLRDYGTGTWEGGSAECDHVKGEMRRGVNLAQSDASTRGGAKKAAEVQDIPYGNVCGKCGAVRKDDQIGLEDTPYEYVVKLVEVFREVRRALRDDGTLWLNIGDTYAGGGQNSSSKPEDLTDKQASNAGCRYERTKVPSGLKPKDLIGIPWRLALALQDDGWYLRQDIIWAKPNPMPESVTDRCTKSHEHVFLLSKSPKYYFDHEAIKEDSVGPVKAGKPKKRGSEAYAVASGVNGNAQLFTRKNDGKRNKRDVWTIATQPYSGAHFAVFPEKLVEPCILAGSKPGDTALDPFCGSGTVGVVADHYGRNFIGVELNPEYIELAHKRIAAGSKKLGAKETNEQSVCGTGSSDGPVSECIASGAD